MTISTRLLGLMFVAALASGTAGCRGSGDDDSDDSDGDSGTPDAAGGGTSIYDVQSETMMVGTPVKLVGVVITAIDTYGGRVGGIYVQEPAGGPFSGVLVFGGSTDGLAPGDIVTVTGGVKDEFALSDDMTGKKLTEISPPDGGSITVTKTGTGTIPTPAVVDAVAFASSEAEAEKWEGVLIRLDNVGVVSAPRGVSMSDPLLEAMDVTGPVEISSSLTDLDMGIAIGACYMSITGIGDYFFTYKVLPRSAADFVTGGTGCPTEDDAATCADMIDNDHDGHTDCADFSCQDVMGVDCQQDTDIVAIQNGTIPPGTQVKLVDVIVTAKAKFKFDGSTTEEHRVWVQDAVTGAPYNGILVFKATYEGVAGIDALNIGDVVDVEGAVSEFFMLTEIAGPTMSPPKITFKSTGPAPTPLVLPIATLTTAASAEMYEGVLVKVENVKVVLADNMNGEYTVGTAGAPLPIDDTIMKKPMGLAADQCIASIVGPFDYTFDFFKLQARDVVTMGGVCP